MIDKLLLEVSAISKKYALIRQKTGAFFNIFDIADISTDEIVICKLLYELLNPKGSHYQGNAFLRLFVSEILQLDFTEQDYKTARVFKEYVIQGKRRIDLYIETANHKIPIEVKIYAGDQERQCFDYYKQTHNANVYYLTLNGGQPSEESAEGLTPLIYEHGEVTGYEEITPLSFEHDIVQWIDKCLALPEIIKIAPIREILLQFKDILLKLTGQMESDEKMEIVNAILASPDAIKTAIDIEKALPEVKSTIMRNLLRELKRMFESKGMTVFNYDEDSINEYYTSHKNLFPGLCIEVFKISGSIEAIFYVEIYWNLYFGFSFIEKGNDGSISFLETDAVKTKHPRKYAEFVSLITDVMGKCEKPDKNSVYWELLFDDNGENYDFKHFSPSCANLAANYTVQAKKMFDLMYKHLRSISRKING